VGRGLKDIFLQLDDERELRLTEAGTGLDDTVAVKFLIGGGLVRRGVIVLPFSLLVM
jgi:hypothetical protein